MKEFEKYILENHPDPDSVLIDNLHRWDEICLLAENYAKDKVKLNLPLVMPELLCLSKNKYQNITVGKKYKTLFEFDDIYFIYDDKGEKISLTIDDHFEIIAQ